MTTIIIFYSFTILSPLIFELCENIYRIFLYMRNPKLILIIITIPILLYMV